MDHAGVGAAGGDEFGVGPLLGDTPVLEEEDAVGAAEEGGAVRTEDDGAALHKLMERLVDDVLGPRLDGTRGFVEEEKIGIGEEGAGDTDALALTAGKLHPAFADDTLEPLRKPFDEVGGVGAPDGVDEPFLVGVGVA